MKDNFDVQTFAGYANGLEHYLKTPQGKLVTAVFIKELKKAHFIHQGEHLLQLGGLHTDPWLSLFPHQHKFNLNPCEFQTAKNIISLPSQLPFDRHSIDCILMPLYLEGYKGNLMAIFDELDRVVKSCGYVVIWGINPWGAWGHLKHLHLLKTPYQKLNLRYPLFLKKALSARGFHVEYLNGFYFLPPIKSAKMLAKLEVLNEVGMMLWPFPSSFYCMVLKKYNPMGPSPLYNFSKRFALNETLSLYTC